MNSVTCLSCHGSGIGFWLDSPAYCVCAIGVARRQAGIDRRQWERDTSLLSITTEEAPQPPPLVMLRPIVQEVCTSKAGHLFHYAGKKGDSVSPDFRDGVWVTKEPDDLRARLVVHDESNGCSVGAEVNAHDLRRIAAGLLHAADLLDGTVEEPDRTPRSTWERLKKPEVG